MRQNSKDVSSADQAIVTVEKASRKVVFTTGSPSQVTMSLVTSSPLAKSSVQVHNLSTQSSQSGSPSTHLSLVPQSSGTVNSVTTPIVSAPPLSIQLARPAGSQVGPNGPTHQTLTVVPSGLRIEQQPSLVVVRQSELQKQQQQMQQNKSEQDLSIVKANSVKELWINRIAPPPSVSSHQQDHTRTVTGLPITGPAPGSGVPMPRLVNHHVTTGSPMETDTKIIAAADKSMIKEMLLKRGGATTLEPASNLLVSERRDSNSSTGSNQSSNQIVIQVTKPSFDPNQVKLALPNVSLILTPTTSTVAAQSSSCLTVLSSIPHKARSFPQSVPMNSFPQSLTSFTQSVTQATSSQISAYTSESIKVL